MSHPIISFTWYFFSEQALPIDARTARSGKTRHYYQTASQSVLRQAGPLLALDRPSPTRPPMNDLSVDAAATHAHLRFARQETVLRGRPFFDLPASDIGQKQKRRSRIDIPRPSSTPISLSSWHLVLRMARQCPSSPACHRRPRIDVLDCDRASMLAVRLSTLSFLSTSSPRNRSASQWYSKHSQNLLHRPPFADVLQRKPR